jgi:hypothetical protein
MDGYDWTADKFNGRGSPLDRVFVGMVETQVDLKLDIGEPNIAQHEVHVFNTAKHFFKYKKYKILDDLIN